MNAPATHEHTKVQSEIMTDALFQNWTTPPPDHEYWCFLDESGTPDYDPDSKPYFSFGSAVFDGDHGDEYMKVLRARAARTGVQSGFHASHDSNATRQCFFECIGEMDVRFYATFMAKPRAYDYVRRRGNLWLYKWTLFSHTGALIKELWDGRSRIVVHLVVAKINLSSREKSGQGCGEGCVRAIRSRQSTRRASHLGFQFQCGTANRGLWSVGSSAPYPVRRNEERAFQPIHSIQNGSRCLVSVGEGLMKNKTDYPLSRKNTRGILVVDLALF